MLKTIVRPPSNTTRALNNCYDKRVVLVSTVNANHPRYLLYPCPSDSLLRQAACVKQSLRKHHRAASDGYGWRSQFLDDHSSGLVEEERGNDGLRAILREIVRPVVVADMRVLCMVSSAR